MGIAIRTFLISLITCFLSCFYTLFGGLGAASWAEEPRVAVVLSSEIRPYIQALDGLKSAFPFYIPVFPMNNPELVLQRLKTDDYERVIVVGSNAAKMVLSHVSDKKKVVLLMVLDIREGFGDGVCGVDMRVPIENELRIISEQLGGALRIAVLFSTEENGIRVREVEKTAQKLGITLIPWRVSDRITASELLSSEAGNVDCLLFLPDPIFDSETFISHLIKTALLNGVAPIGYNRFFVETGAVLSFNLDYAAIGRQGASFLTDRTRCGILSPAFQIEINEKSLELVRKRWKERRP